MPGAPTTSYAARAIVEVIDVVAGRSMPRIEPLTVSVPPLTNRSDSPGAVISEPDTISAVRALSVSAPVACTTAPAGIWMTSEVITPAALPASILRIDESVPKEIPLSSGDRTITVAAPRTKIMRFIC
jgi:hypothetical protein